MIDQRRFTKAGNVLSILCLLLPGYQLTGTVVGGWKALATLRASGIGDPSSLVGGMGEAVKIDFFGVFLLLLGLGSFGWVRLQERKFCAIELPPSPSQQ